jgi:L-iditol 2-dehydrogenase
MIEPTAVGVHAVRRLELAAISQLLVVGAGTIGLQTMQAARALGIPEVIVTDLSAARLARARALGATQVVNVANVALTDWMRAHYDRPNPMDAAIECVGAGAEAINSAIESVKKGRRIIVAGVWGSRPQVNMGLIQDRELELVGTLMYTRDDFTAARDLIANGRIQVKPLVTACYPLDQTAQAFAAASGDAEKTLKVLVIIRSA